MQRLVQTQNSTHATPQSLRDKGSPPTPTSIGIQCHYLSQQVLMDLGKSYCIKSPLLKFIWINRHNLSYYLFKLANNSTVLSPAFSKFSKGQLLSYTFQFLNISFFVHYFSTKYFWDNFTQNS